MILAVTGHRPPKIGGYRVPNRMSVEVLNLVMQYLQREQPEVVITGMALGFDQWVAELCLRMGVPYHAYVPFAGQDNLWPDRAKEHYRLLINNAASVQVICRGGYSPEAMQIRNRAMVDAANKVLALWNGTPGGTANCINYALSRNRQVDRLPVSDGAWAWCREQEALANASRRSRFDRGTAGEALGAHGQERIYRRRRPVQNPPEPVPGTIVRSTAVDDLMREQRIREAERTIGFAEQLMQQREEVARAFAVPAQLLGVDQASGPDETRVTLPENMDDETARAMLRALQDRLGTPKPKKQDTHHSDRFAPKRKIDLDD